MRSGFEWFLFGAAAMVLAAGAGAAVAQAAADEEIVKVRRAAMKELSAHGKAIAAFLKGDSDAKKARALGSAADMEIRGLAVAGLAKRVPALFPDGTGDKGRMQAACAKMGKEGCGGCRRTFREKLDQ